MKRGKKYQDALKLVDVNKRYTYEEAVDLVKKTSFSKFDGTVEIAMRLNLDQRKAEQNIRGALVLPNGTGKETKVVVITVGAKAEEAKKAGADFVGDDDLIQKMNGGWLDFDTVIATPDMMAKLGRIGKVLGPRGLMPNPKTGTVTLDVAKAVQEAKSGKIEYRLDKFGNIHAPIGKVSFEKEKLVENAKTLVTQILRVKPSTVKGGYIKNITLSATQGPGIKLDLDQLT